MLFFLRACWFFHYCLTDCVCLLQQEQESSGLFNNVIIAYAFVCSCGRHLACDISLWSLNVYEATLLELYGNLAYFSWAHVICDLKIHGCRTPPRGPPGSSEHSWSLFWGPWRLCTASAGPPNCHFEKKSLPVVWRKPEVMFICSYKAFWGPGKLHRAQVGLRISYKGINPVLLVFTKNWKWFFPLKWPFWDLQRPQVVAHSLRKASGPKWSPAVFLHNSGSVRRLGVLGMEPLQILGAYSIFFNSTCISMFTICLQ